MAVNAALQGNGSGEGFLGRAGGCEDLPRGPVLPNRHGHGGRHTARLPGCGGTRVDADVMHGYDRTDTSRGAGDRKELVAGGHRDRGNGGRRSSGESA
jgi:hypothetical protein